MQNEITSLNNDLVKQTLKLHQKKYRDEEKKFLLEGFKAIEEAFLAKIEFEYVFVEKNKAGKYGFIINPSPALRAPSPARGEGKIIITNEAVLKKISTTDSPPEAVAVAKQKIYTLKDIKSTKKVVLLENIKDLGNLGTIIRTAKAFNQDAIILFGQTADIYNPKCVRSAVGNLWKIPIVQIKDFEILKENFNGFDKAAALPNSKGSILLKDFTAKPPYLIMFGSESEGLSKELIDFADKKLTIEMSDEVESLNLAVSVGVVLYKIG